MAVDTRNKRGSCIGLVMPVRMAYPNPDGSLAAQEDRQHIAYAYPGIAASATGQPARRRWSFIPGLGTAQRFGQPMGSEIAGG